MQQPRDWTREASYNSLSFFSCVVAWIKISFSNGAAKNESKRHFIFVLFEHANHHQYWCWAASHCRETGFVDTNHEPQTCTSAIVAQVSKWLELCDIVIFHHFIVLQAPLEKDIDTWFYQLKRKANFTASLTSRVQSCSCWITWQYTCTAMFTFTPQYHEQGFCIQWQYYIFLW